MAGSSISGGRTGSTNTSRKPGSKTNPSNRTDHPGTTNGDADSHNGHANGHTPGNGSGSGSTYRVTIDVRKIQANVYANEGGKLSDLAVRNWLRSVGFHPEAGGRTWLADVESISRLDKSEIVRADRLQGGAARI